MHVEREMGSAERDGLTRRRRGTRPFFLGGRVSALCHLCNPEPTALSL